MENYKSAKGGDFREVSYSKSRYEEAPPTMRLQWDHPTHWYTLIPPSAGAEAILKLLTNAGVALSVKQIAEETGETEAKTRRDLAKMLDDKPARVKRFQVPGEGYMYRVQMTEDEEGRIDY
jgi:hypothetical protein